MRTKKGLIVLITGCSSGLGRTLAVEFARQGHTVFATSRHVEDIAHLAGQRISILPLDVTDASSISAAVQRIWERIGRIDMLVNNAGFGLMGPLLELPLDEVRLEFETNVFGPLALVQAVVPYMVKQRSGRIVNVGSVSGVLTSPFAGPYCASKAALHSLSDAMRLEMAPFGIEVIVLQPSKITSKFGDTASRILKELIPQNSLYSPILQYVEKRAGASQLGGADATRFARRIVFAVSGEKPPLLLRFGKNSWAIPFYKWAFPISLLDLVLRRIFGLHLLRQPSTKN